MVNPQDQPPSSSPTPTSTPTTSDTEQQKQDIETLTAPAMLHTAAIGVAVLGPIALLLPGKGRGRLNVQNMILSSGTFWAYNQLAHDYTGKSIVVRSNERWGAVLASADQLPSQAETNRRLMQEERARLRRLKEGGLEGEKGEEGEGKRGVLAKVWMGDEKEGWKEKRLEEERKALESGKGYADLIVEQIWDVWNQTWRGGSKGEDGGKKEEGSGKDGKQ